MKRFWLFGGTHYYPCGGMEDLLQWYETAEEARSAAVGEWKYKERDGTYTLEWWQIVSVSSSGAVLLDRSDTEGLWTIPLGLIEPPGGMPDY